MSFFDSILFNCIATMFPLLAYLLYLACKSDINKNNYNEMIFELVMISSVFLTIKLAGNKYSNYSLVLLNIPILFSYLRGKNSLALLLSGFEIIYYNFILDYSVFVLIFEYLSYFLLHVICNKSDITSDSIINRFVFLKAIFFSHFIFYTNMNASFFSIFMNVFISLLVFAILSKLYYSLLCKGEELINLNNSIKDLEREKTLRNALFKLTHEIKNPIAVCKGYLDMLDLNNKESSKKYIKTIKGEIERTLVIMDDFLDYSKIKVTKNIMDVNYLLEDTLSSINSLFTNNDIEIKSSISDDEIFIDGDYNRLKQVIINILKNSIEAKKEDKDLKVFIKTELKNKKINIIIKDNGIGMDLDELNSIGKSFYTTKPKGTGLGVLLSREIIEAHDGDIVYTSSKGVGTTVTIILPILDFDSSENQEK